MRRLSSQMVWPHAVLEIFDAGAEVDITLTPGHSRICLTRAQARRVARALLRFADSKTKAGSP